jgi:hypothetical protein
MRSFLERGIPFDDVVAFNDVIALGAYCSRRGPQRSEDTPTRSGPEVAEQPRGGAGLQG